MLDELEEAFLYAKSYVKKYFSEKYSEDAWKVLFEGDPRTNQQKINSPTGLSRGVLSGPNPIEEETIVSQY